MALCRLFVHSFIGRQTPPPLWQVCFLFFRLFFPCSLTICPFIFSLCDGCLSSTSLFLFSRLVWLTYTPPPGCARSPLFDGPVARIFCLLKVRGWFKPITGLVEVFSASLFFLAFPVVQPGFPPPTPRFGLTLERRLFLSERWSPGVLAPCTSAHLLLCVRAVFVLDGRG